MELKTGGEAGDQDAGMTGEAVGVAGVEVDYGADVNNAASTSRPGGVVKTNENNGKKQLNFLELDTNAEFLEVQPGKISQQEEDYELQKHRASMYCITMNFLSMMRNGICIAD